jgi:hypothetical protein
VVDRVDAEDLHAGTPPGVDNVGAPYPGQRDVRARSRSCSTTATRASVL